MTEESAWRRLTSRIFEFREGDIEWHDETAKGLGRLYRARIRKISRVVGDKQINMVLSDWTAMQPLNAGSSWIEVKPKNLFVFFASDKYLEVSDGPNNQLDFVAKNKRGTLYPKGQNLSLRKVRRLPA